MGADAAARQLRIDPRTVVKWMRDAGDPPALRGTQEQWRQQFELAHARLMEKLASPKITIHDLVLAKGVAERNMKEASDAPPESAVAAHGAYLDWLLDASGALDVDTPEEAIDALLPELIRRANGEEGQPHRPAILAWFSGRPEVAAGGVLPWAQAETRAILVEHGSLARLWSWHTARAVAHSQALADQLAANRAAAEEWQRRARDTEAVALLAAAEALLADAQR